MALKCIFMGCAAALGGEGRRLGDITMEELTDDDEWWAAVELAAAAATNCW